MKKGADSVTAVIETGGKTSEMTVDRVISAVGIVGNVEGLGLEGTGVKVDRSHIVIDEYCQTGEPGVYAIGDVTGAPWLAHKASHEGVICVERIAGVNDVHPLDVGNIPGCTYSRPQIASVGLTEAKAKAAGHEVKVGRFPFIGNGKAIAMGEPEGMVKTVFDAKTGELLGAHMIGAEVTEMIQGYTIARTLETTEKELMHTVFPHPTVSETMHEGGAWGVRAGDPLLRVFRGAPVDQTAWGSPPRVGRNRKDVSGLRDGDPAAHRSSFDATFGGAASGEGESAG